MSVVAEKQKINNPPGWLHVALKDGYAENVEAIAYLDDGPTLLINSKEQMFTEKLRSILKFGPTSTRHICQVS